jgi:ribosomal protein S18 acetylase RimI-like enzyme
MTDAIDIRPLDGDPDLIERLADILIATVAAGGSVSFLYPMRRDAAVAYWRDALADAGRIVLGGFLEGELAGTVTLWLATPPNQPFRGEIWKLMTAPAARRRGLAGALMREAERFAVVRGKRLLTLDTASDGGAAALYESLGWVRAGVIPDYACKPHGGLTGTVIFYKQLAPPCPPSSPQTSPALAR